MLTPETRTTLDQKAVEAKFGDLSPFKKVTEFTKLTIFVKG